MKILFVVFGTAIVPASRYRVYQYFPSLDAKNIKYEVFSAISERLTLQSIRSPGFSNTRRLFYYLHLSVERFVRFWYVFFKAGQYDILFLQRVTFPLGLGKILKFMTRAIIFDIDDAIFLPDTHTNKTMTKLKRFIKGSEVKDMVRASKAVIVENDYISVYVSKYCKNVYKIPGPIDTDRYFVKLKQEEGKKEIYLGWIGSPGTTAYLNMLNDVFYKLFDTYPNVRLVLIGAGKYELKGNRIIKRSWKYETEVSDLQEFDIGIMPMPDDEWTKGKLGCKMLQYMAVGVPSVVSYTQTNAELIKDGRNGFMAREKKDWIDILSKLIDDPVKRQLIGAEGRATVEKLCSIKNNAPKLVDILESLKK